MQGSFSIHSEESSLTHVNQMRGGFLGSTLLLLNNRSVWAPIWFQDITHCYTIHHTIPTVTCAAVTCTCHAMSCSVLAKVPNPFCFIQAFQHFDADHSGFITPDEVEKALKTLGGASSADAADMVRQYDLNQDGQIDYNEFIAMLRKQDNTLQQASSFFKSLRVPEGVQIPA